MKLDMKVHQQFNYIYKSSCQQLWSGGGGEIFYSIHSNAQNTFLTDPECMKMFCAYSVMRGCAQFSIGKRV